MVAYANAPDRQMSPDSGDVDDDLPCCAAGAHDRDGVFPVRASRRPRRAQIDHHRPDDDRVGRDTELRLVRRHATT